MEQLREQPRDFRLLVRRAKAKGITQLTMRRAARGLGVIRTVTGFGTNKRSVWSLDADAIDSLKEQRALIEYEIARVIKRHHTAETEAESATYFKMLSALKRLR